MQRSDEILALLSDLDDHLDDQGLVGNVWSDVVTAMERAWEQLHDYDAGARGEEALTRAAEEVQYGVARLVAVHSRLARLTAKGPARPQSSQEDPQSLRVRWVATDSAPEWSRGLFG